MKKIKLAVLISFALSGWTMSSQAEDYIEAGRFGVEGLISNDGFQAGIVRETNNYEVALDLDGSMVDRNSSSSGTPQNGDIGVEVRVGLRNNLGSYNYFSYGIDYQTSLFGRVDGATQDGSFSAGPYVGFQRHFSGTNLMLSLVMIPVSYNIDKADSQKVVSYKVFQQGAFGIAYLF